MEPTTNPADLAHLAADLTLLIERVLALTVTIALGGGILLVAILLLFFRVGTAEHRIGERVDATGKDVVRKVNGRISDLDLVPPQDTQAQTSPLSTRSRRRI